MPPKKKRKVPARRKSRSNLWLIAALVVIVIVAATIFLTLGANQAVNEYSDKSTKVLLHTTAGDITLELRDDKPTTTTNFINIVKNGWYDNTTFHRTISGFMIQGGILDGHTVSTIPDEIGSNNRNTAYTIAMARTTSSNTATSQFFINVADNGQAYKNINFDETYTVFGKVIAGQDVVDAIANAPTTENPSMQNENSLPVNPVTIISATILS
jgi:peptidyl-prolyl cis-trans isomerase A (cyclophilin A)